MEDPHSLRAALETGRARLYAELTDHLADCDACRTGGDCATRLRTFEGLDHYTRAIRRTT